MGNEYPLFNEQLSRSLRTRLQRQVALVDLAYVKLGLNDPVAALTYAGRLLATPASVINR